MFSSVVLPPEIQNFFSHFTEKEQQLLKERGGLSHNASIKQMLEILLEVYYSIVQHSDSFCFLLGRLLYFFGDFDRLTEMAVASESPGFMLWDLLRELHKGKLPITLEQLEQLEQKLKGSPLYCFFAYIYAHYFYFTGDFAEYRKKREIIYNLCFGYYSLCFENKAIYKVILGHMFALDATFLRATSTLTISTNRIEEAINLAKATNDRILQVIVYNVAGMIEQEKGNFQLAHQFLLRCQAIAKNADIRKSFSSIYSNLGNLYFLMSQYGEALNWYNKALSELDKWKDDIRPRYLVLSNIAKVYYATEKIKEAIKLMEEVLKLLENTQIKEFSMQFQYIEFLLTDGNLDISKQKLQEMKEYEDTFSTSQKAHYAYLQGLLELHMHNYGLAEQYLQKALSIADFIGNETISYESLAVLLLVYLHRYELNQKLDDILMADKCLEDIIAYLQEKAKYDAIVLLYYTRAKIKIIIYNFEIAYFLLKQGEKYARIYAPEMTQRYATQFQLLQLILEKEKIDNEIITEKIDFRFEMTNY
ncbi:MAG: tetratricopeptide repeat protein, partial [Candidatus Heimdallarchaeaceae archaeon]